MWENWIAFVAAILTVMITPGPSQLLMLSNCANHGLKKSLATAAGDLSANTIQMLAVSMGLASLLVASHLAFAIVKWLGVIYLVYLGMQRIMSKNWRRKSSITNPASCGNLFFQGFATSISNPKAIVFFAALFPLFLKPEVSLVEQLVLLGVTYLVIDAMFLIAYGSVADRAYRRLHNGSTKLLDQLSGALLIVAALLLSYKQLPAPVFSK